MICGSFFTAKVTSNEFKMLYASTRNSLMKSLGSAHFTDSLFATSKADLTPEAYASHKKHVAAPKPLSAREQEMADIKAAERESGGGTYDGSRTRQNHLGTGVGLNWSPEVEDAVKELCTGESSRLVVIVSDTSWLFEYICMCNSIAEHRCNYRNTADNFCGRSYCRRTWDSTSFLGTLYVSSTWDLDRR
jgi:hypothetical protein